MRCKGTIFFLNNCSKKDTDMVFLCFFMQRYPNTMAFVPNNRTLRFRKII